MKNTKKILLFVCILFFLIFLTASLTFNFVTINVNLDEKKLYSHKLSAQIYDKNDNEVKNVLPTSYRETVDISKLSPYVKQAFIDVEDRRFFSHKGFDTKRMLKAAYKNLLSRSFKEGASTISQQLIKNTHLTHEKTIKRKLKELKLTAQLEKRFNKEEILEKYLNTIYFGHSCFGIKAAAKFYFDKSPAELDAADSAILAGLVKSPNNYSPFKNANKCQARKESVLKCMLELGHITRQEFDDAIRKPLPQKLQNNMNDGKYFDLLFDEIERLSEQYAFPVNGNMRVYTYFSQNLQEKLSAIATNANSDKSIVALENKTGGVQAYYSSVGDISRLPASLIKPLLVYAPAMEEKIITPVTPILDEKINFDGYSPQNYDGTYNGYVSVRESVAKSLNIPAVKTLNSLGIDTASFYMQKLGLNIQEEDKSLALALGGMKTGYSLNQLASAYAAFANDGYFLPARFVRAIYIEEQCVYKKEEKKTQVFSPATCFLMNDMLKNATQNGTAKKLRALPFPIAAKTGTSGTKLGNIDAYTIAYTPAYTIGVWLGNANNEQIEYTGGGLPCQMAKDAFDYLYQTSPQNCFYDFSKPSSVKQVKLDKTEYYATHNIVLADDISPPEYTFSEYFEISSVPRKKCDKFSNPSISIPTLCYQNGQVSISFDKNAPEYYEYLIERYDYDRHKTLYRGKKLSEFYDKNLEENKKYVYTVTPIYQNKKGKPIVLPTISTKAGELPPPPILKDEWWKY